MRRRVTIDRLDVRVRGQVDDPRALARAIAAAVADRLAEESGKSGSLADAGAARRLPTIDAGAASAREAPSAAAEATLAAVIAAGAPATKDRRGREGGS